MLHHRQLTLVVLSILLLATACRRSNEEASNLKNVYVAPTTINCTGVSPQQCYLVTEDLSAGWELFYDEIREFGYQPGFFYQLQVAESAVENPPADSSSVQWTWQETLIMDPAVVRTVTIGAERVDCAEANTGLCYQYLPDAGSQWLLYPDEIEGFTYEPGYYYELTVADRRPSDGSGPVWTAMQVLSKSGTLPAAPAAAGAADATAVPGTASSDTGEATPPAFKPIAILDQGLRTVVPESWSAVGNDNRAWAGNSAYFVNFSLSPGFSARAVLEQMTAAAGTDTQGPGIFDAEVNGRTWSIYTRTDGSLTTTVAATLTDGNVHVVSLFADPNETDAILQAVLENFEVGEPAP